MALSEECKKRLREIERQLSRALTNPNLDAGLLTVTSGIQAAQPHIDQDCREILRELEPKIQYARSKLGHMKPHLLLPELRVAHAEFRQTIELGAAQRRGEPA